MRRRIQRPHQRLFRSLPQARSQVQFAWMVVSFTYSIVPSVPSSNDPTFFLRDQPSANGTNCDPEPQPWPASQNNCDRSSHAGTKKSTQSDIQVSPFHIDLKIAPPLSR